MGFAKLTENVALSKIYVRQYLRRGCGQSRGAFCDDETHQLSSKDRRAPRCEYATHSIAPAPPEAEEGGNEKMTRRIESMIPSPKHGVKSNPPSIETGPIPRGSRGRWLCTSL